MKLLRVGVGIVASILVLDLVSQAQQMGATNASITVPALVNFSGVLTAVDGKPLTGIVGVTFYLYQQQQGGSPLWMETQNVQADKNGNYTVQLGASSTRGLPADLFVSGEARWLAIQPEGQGEQPRVMLLSVPYALKAGDAQTVGGLPASAFVQVVTGGGNDAAPSSGTSSSAAPNVGGGGTENFIPLWMDNLNDLGNSAMFQTGNSPTARIGINTMTPAGALDVKGTATVRGQLSVIGLLSLGPTNGANATRGFNSQQINQVASSFNSGTGKAVNQTFQWQAEPAGNDTMTPSGTLNLLFGSGVTPTETGLHIGSNGLITFTPGQTFPGTGTVTSVGSGAGLTGGPITASGTLSIANGAVTNNMLATPSLTVAAGMDLTGGGLVSLGGTTALNLDTTKVPQLNTTNTFFGAQTINGSISATSTNGNGVYGNGLTGLYGVSTVSPGGPGGYFQGFTAPIGSNLLGNTGVDAYGGNADLSNSAGQGGIGVRGRGGDANGRVASDGIGGALTGGTGSSFGDGVFAVAGSGYAGGFAGDIYVTGSITAGTKDFRIDHPLDPANRYLIHASVESSEMKNIYDGVVTTDARGEATVSLPDWFEVLNTDFRYQLTVIGQFAQAIVGHEIQDHKFQIRTNAPDVKVSWQVTGVRHDAFAKAHPLVVEQEKEARLKGFYIHPQLYGQSEEKQIEWARHPELMKRLKQQKGALREMPVNTQTPITH